MDTTRRQEYWFSEFPYGKILTAPPPASSPRSTTESRSNSSGAKEMAFLSRRRMTSAVGLPPFLLENSNSHQPSASFLYTLSFILSLIEGEGRVRGNENSNLDW